MKSRWTISFCIVDWYTTIVLTGSQFRPKSRLDRISSFLVFYCFEVFSDYWILTSGSSCGTSFRPPSPSQATSFVQQPWRMLQWRTSKVQDSNCSLFFLLHSPTLTGSLRLPREDLVVLFKPPTRSNIFLQVKPYLDILTSIHLKSRCETTARHKTMTMSPCGHFWFLWLRTSLYKACRFFSKKNFCSMQQVCHAQSHLTTDTFPPERFLFQVMC